MKVTQLKDIVNNVTSEVLGKENVLAEDLSNLVDVGNEIVDYHIIAQIVSGVSFIGAGLIFKDKSVHNLTTAILVWSMVAIAVLLGLGYIIQALLYAIIIWLLLIYKRKKYEND